MNNKFYLKKENFYKEFENFQNKNLPIHFFHYFNKHYCLIFDWSSITSNGNFNPIMTAQLTDLKKSGSKKYVTKDLNWDCQKEKTTTQYQLYKFLRDWVQKAINAYECDIKDYLENCEDCGFCKIERKDD